MMSPCLAPDEFVDLIDGTLPPARRTHVETCARCRATADEVGDAWRAAAAIAVPEPSALFWSSINARVRAAIASPAGARGRAWWRWPMLVPAGLVGAALVAVVVTLALSSRLAEPTDEPAGVESTAAARPAAPAIVDAEIAPSDDAGLALMMDLAVDLPDGAWNALGVRSLPEIDVAVSVLSAEEQRALAALLEAEVSRSKS